MNTLYQHQLKHQPVTRQPVVHIVDDSESMRNSLVMLLYSADLESRCYDSAEEFLQQYVPGSPGCLLLDIRMPKMSGLELQKLLPQYHISIPVIMMTGYADVPTAIRAMKAGAFDFVEKPFNQLDLLQRINTCIENSLSRPAYVEHDERVDLMSTLTPRELQVLDLLVEGKINKVIASELGISTRTVEAHRANLMEKLRAKSISDVVRIALLSQVANI